MARVDEALSATHMELRHYLTLLHVDEGRRGLSSSALYQYEHESIPGRHYLRALKEAYPEHYERIEAMTIETRLDAIHEKLERGALGEAQRHLYLMPVTYWRAAVHQANQGGSTPDHDQPAWHAKIIPLETEGEYLRALRNALELSPNEVAQAHGISVATIRRAENSNHGAQAMKDALLDYYRGKEIGQRESGTLPPDMPLLVNPATYRQLDGDPVRHDAAAKRQPLRF